MQLAVVVKSNLGKPGRNNLGQNTKHPNSTTLKKPKQIQNEH